ncbi:adhesion G-protein coupled receptor G6-like, partial [Argonauta hians]
SNNKISVIAPLSFRNLRDLRQLNLRGNSLTYLYLEGLVSLEILDLSNNTIRSIGRGTFRNLPNLRKLNLRGNRMLSFNDGGFEDLVSLEILDFGENNLYSVDPKTFKKMISLQQLYLDHNRMLTSLARVQLPKLSKYTLNGTQVKCNCSLQAYLKQFQETWGRPLNIDIACSINMSLTNWKKKCQDFLGKELKCYKCDGRGCSEPNATFCQHDSDVCMSKISATDDIQRIEKSCSPAKKCFRAEINNINTCKFNSNKYACTICCTDQRCNFNRYKGWLRRFQLMLTFHIDKDFSSDSENERSMNYSYLARNISRILVDELHKYHGIFNIRVNFLRRPEDTVDIECSVAIGCTVLTDIKEDIVWHWINHTVTTSKQFDYLNVKKNTVYLRGEMICNANETRLKGRYMWPVTTVGTTIKLPCKTNNNTASRTCYRMPMHLEMAEQRQVPPQWMTGYWSLPNMSLCEDADWIRKSLLNINSDDIDEDDIDDSSLKLENVTKSAVYFQERDIAIYVDILEKMIPLVPAIPANTTSQYILGSINNIIGAPEKILVKAESSNNSANRILKGLGRIDNKFPLEDELQEFTVCYSRVGIGISRVEAHQFNGLTYSTSTKQNTIYNMSYNPEEMLLEQTDFISLPASLLDNLTGEEKSSISRIVFHHLTDDKLFRVIQKSENTTGQRVLGQVLTSDVPNIRITSLKDPILIAFNLLNMTDMKNMKPQCVYWDNLSKEKSHWSDNGCIVQTYIPGKNVTCACNHLTSFAIILNIYDSNVPQEHMEIQSVISNISCAISLACLVFTIVIYVSSK